LALSSPVWGYSPLNLWCRLYAHALLRESQVFPDIELCGDSPDYTPRGFTDIWKGNCRGELVYVKAIRAQNPCIDERVWMNVFQRFCREGVAWKHLRHPNILPLLGVTMGEHQFVLVSEWMENGNINRFIERDQRLMRYRSRPALSHRLRKSYSYKPGVKNVPGG